MIVDLEVIDILLIKQNFIICTYFIGTRSFGLFFLFWDFISSQYCAHYILCFECKTFAAFLISPDPSILLCLFLHFPLDVDYFTQDIFFPSKSLFHSSIHSPCWLSVLFLLSKSFQSLFFMPLRGIKKGWSLNYYFSLKQGECRVC